MKFRKIKIPPIAIDSLQTFHTELQLARNEGEMIAIMRRRGAADGWWSDIPRELWDRLESLSSI
jgi:hypothetical protein